MNQLQHRQTEARLRIMNPDGTPIANQEIQIDQATHTFLFGCGAFDTVALMKATDEKQRAFLLERMVT